MIEYGDGTPVRVFNKNPGKLTDKFAGEEYTFHPGASKVVPREVARHFFGYGLTDKEKNQKLQRMGLNLQKDGQKIFNNFVVKEMASGADELHKPSSPLAA